MYDVHLYCCLWIQNGISIHRMIGLCCPEKLDPSVIRCLQKKASNMFTYTPENQHVT